jgi:hypothetical protein
MESHVAEPTVPHTEDPGLGSMIDEPTEDSDSNSNSENPYVAEQIKHQLSDMKNEVTEIKEEIES